MVFWYCNSFCDYQMIMFGRVVRDAKLTLACCCVWAVTPYRIRLYLESIGNGVTFANLLNGTSCKTEFPKTLMFMCFLPYKTGVCVSLGMWRGRSRQPKGSPVTTMKMKTRSETLTWIPLTPSGSLLFSYWCKYYCILVRYLVYINLCYVYYISFQVSFVSSKSCV